MKDDSILTTTRNITNISEYLKNTEISGKKLYKKNSHYKKLSNCLEHPEFRDFIESYFLKEQDDIKLILMFIKLYIKIEKSACVKLNGYQKLSILDSFINNSEFRKEICKNYDDILKLK